MTEKLKMTKTIHNVDGELTATFKFGLVTFKGQRTRCRPTVDVRIRYDKYNRPCFSAMADVKCGRSWVMGGQCLDSIYRDSFGMRHSPTFKTIYGLWERNHLNDLKAAVNEEQQKLVDEFVANYPEDYHGHPSYTKVCDYLKSIGKFSYVVDGKTCNYGERWYYRPISDEDMAAINELFELTK
jgi:hypothetical protein